MLSILIPVHNEAEHLAACLNSIQTSGLSVEVVLVDDRSEDESHAIAQAWEPPEGVRLTLLRNPGEGKAAALNHAFENATGDTFILLGGDDLLVSDLLPARADAVRGTHPKVAMCQFKTFSDHLEWDGILLPRFRGGTQVAGGAVSFNRACAEAAFPIPESLPNEDTWLRAITILMDLTVAEVPGIGLHYRIHAGNDTGLMRPYAQVDRDMVARANALSLALAERADLGTDAGRAALRTLITAEAARHKGQWWRLLAMPGLSRADRATQLANAGPIAFGLKQALIRANRWRRRSTTTDHRSRP